MTENFGSLDQLNAAAGEKVANMARELREGILELSGAVLRNMLFKDILNQEFSAESHDREFWVTPALAELPGAENLRGPSCLSFMVEEDAPVQRKGRMRVLVPIPEDFDRRELEDVAELPEPDAVFIERQVVAKPGQVYLLSRYMVARQVSLPYQGDEPEGEFGDLQEYTMERRAPEELGDLSRILVNLDRWKIRPQRQVHVDAGHSGTGEDL